MSNHPNRSRLARNLRAAAEGRRGNQQEPATAPRGNQPDFDPLHPTPEQEADMVAGYTDGCTGAPPRADASLAYAHGRRNGTNDRAHTVEPEQRELARRMRAEGRI